MQITSAEEARRFLLGHQPLPPDGAWSDELAESVASLRQHLQAHPDDALLELLVQSPGEWSGRGQYQLFPRVLVEHAPDRVAAALRVALGSRHASVRYWSAQFAGEGWAPDLLDRLEPLLADPDEGVRESDRRRGGVGGDAAGARAPPAAERRGALPSRRGGDRRGDRLAGGATRVLGSAAAGGPQSFPSSRKSPSSVVYGCGGQPGM
ncbi:MAG TPA: hypothetical protein VEB43_02390 [Anaeromyxobacter sp.]|nr:hypothetical protein [Anaeromyxobacter sp.]